MRKRCIGERSFLFRAKRRKYRVRDREGEKKEDTPSRVSTGVAPCNTHTHKDGRVADLHPLLRSDDD